MDFKDFQNNPQDLVGKRVLYEGGMSYSDSKRRSITKIEKVTKTGFRLFAMPDSLFSLNDGSQKGLTGRMNMGTVSQCTLITDEEATAYIETWKQNREEKALREEMKAKFDTFTFEQLVKMKELL
jgi:hypothetical protein